MSEQARTAAGSAAAGPAAGGREARGEVEIAAPAETVWRALTEGAELERWFPLEARVEPGPDGSVWMSWQNEFAAELDIVAWEPPRRLATSWLWHAEQGAAQVTEYEIEARGDRTLLRVVTSGFPEGPDWDDWVEGTTRGWRFELRSLKHYLERHAGEPREVIYLRRRVAQTRDEAYAALMEAAQAEPGVDLGAAFDRVSGWQHAAVVQDPPDGLLRLSVEPSMGQPARDVTVWLSAWGDARAELPRHRARWESFLERTFPAGEAV